ncbi:MAG: hypothetical protein EG823_07775 [Actinobacteria bacterium]|nr:hypothetical protein [Actinomycetota bacterium]
MACYLLHVLEQQDEDPYQDPDVKDVVGTLPQFYCTKCQPILRLKPSEGIRCVGLEAPCWMPGGGPVCPDAPPTQDPWDPKTQL